MGSVSDDANDRNLGLFSDLEAPSINDGVVELTFKSSKQDGTLFGAKTSPSSSSSTSASSFW